MTKIEKRRPNTRRSTIRARTLDIARYCADQDNFSPEDAKLLNHLLDQGRRTAIQAGKAVDDALAHIAESERRLAKLDKFNQQRMAIASPRRRQSWARL